MRNKIYLWNCAPTFTVLEAVWKIFYFLPLKYVKGESWSWGHKSCPCPLPAALLMMPCTSPGVTIESTLWAEVWVSQPRVVNMGELCPFLFYLVTAWVGERCILLSMPEAGGRAGAEVIRVEEPFLPLISCNTQKAIPAPHLGNIVELALKVEVWENLTWGCERQEGRNGPHPCSHRCNGLTSQDNAEEFTLVAKTEEIWQTDQPRNYPDPERGLCVDSFQYPPHLWSPQACRGFVPADPWAAVLQDLHDTGKQLDV